MRNESITMTLGLAMTAPASAQLCEKPFIASEQILIGEIEMQSFGEDVDGIGDFDGDGVPDLVVGARSDDSTGPNTGAVFIVLLNSDGSEKQRVRIDENSPGFPGNLGSAAMFGEAVSRLGDIDGDGTPDIAVGAQENNSTVGSVYTFLLNPDGTIKSGKKIIDSGGGGTGVGLDLAGDIDGDGVNDLVAGEPIADTGGFNRGAVNILLLHADGSLKQRVRTAAPSLDFASDIAIDDQFGLGVAGLGDFDGDGVPDIAVGIRLDDVGGTDTGAVAICFLNSDGSIRETRRIDLLRGNLPPVLSPGDNFGRSLANAGDLNADGVVDLFVGASGSDIGGPNRGAVYAVTLNADATVNTVRLIADTSDAAPPNLNDSDQFGIGIGRIGDVNGDGIDDFAVGAFDDTLGTRSGAVRVFLRGGLPVSPQISAEPLGEIVGPISGDAVFSIGADGILPLEYQWFRGGDALMDGDGITGSTAPTLTLTDADSSAIGMYSCRVTNALGEATTRAAVLGVIPGHPADQNFDGVVSPTDFGAWLANFNAAQ